MASLGILRNSGIGPLSSCEDDRATQVDSTGLTTRLIVTYNEYLQLTSKICTYFKSYSKVKL